ncbi:MAG: T9SS type A sorting domain-containing protein [Marinilabiliaceae bacterium]|nr:T9SS type A sorting domain-containing protein [Marinilabiliaceae bacterium]
MEVNDIFGDLGLAPVVSSLTPSNNALYHNTNGHISIELQNSIEVIDFSGITVTPDPGGISASLNAENKSLLEIAHNDFEFETKYTVTIPAGCFRRINSTVTNEEITWSYTTMPNLSDEQVLFSIDLSQVSSFDPENDVVYVSGNCWDPVWPIPGANPALILSDADGDLVYKLVVSLDTPDDYEYKFYINAGWQNGDEFHSGANRTFSYTGQQLILQDIFEFSGVPTSIEYENQEEPVHLYPNPTNGVINLTGGKSYTVKLFSVTGNLLLNRVLNQNTPLDISSYNPGLYIVEIEYETTRNIIKVIKH